MIRYSLFLHSHDAKPKTREQPWEDFARDLGPHEFTFTSKDALPAFSPAEYRQGSVRLAKNVVRVSFGVLDLDQVTAGQLLGVLRQVEGLDAVFYTTWSHPQDVARGLWRARICIRLSRPVEMSEWRMFWPALANTFGNLTDPQCKDPNRIYYGAFAPPGTEKHAEYFVFRGVPLDVDALLATRLNVSTTPLGVEKIPRERLDRLAARWRRSKDEWRATMGEILTKLVKGEPFAEEGHVDTTVFQLCQDLAKAFPSADPATIAPHFAQSLQVMNYKGLYPLDKVEDKLRKALQNHAAEVAADQEAELTERRLRIRQAFAPTDPARDWPYKETELDAMADRIGVTREELNKRWIIQRGNLFYVLGPNALYSAAYQEKDVHNAVLRDLAPAQTANVDLWTVGNSGPVRKSMSTLMSEFGSVATDYVLDLRAQEARYDSASRLFVDAPCPLRPLTPAYDHDVARWLHIMCGDRVHDVLTWLSLVTNLEEPCAALFFSGAKGVGKSLFAGGVARLWTVNGETKLSSAMGDFNDMIVKCPLIFADEQLPKDWRGHGRTSELREFIAEQTRPFKKKYYPETSILGAIRLVIAANNEDILAIQEHLTVNDIEAIGDRFYHVPVNPRAAEFLAACDARSFVLHDRLARHALWLRDNHRYERKGRFLIQSPDRQLFRSLTTQSGIRSAVCQWAIGYLKNPRPVDAKGDLLVRVNKGRLCVRPEGILNSWDTYVTNESVPPTGQLSRAITGLSKEERAHLTVSAGVTVQYKVIDPEILYAWAESTEFATKHEIDTALSKTTEGRF